jgi:head-tail adaptor
MARIGLNVGKYNKWVTLSQCPQPEGATANFDPLTPAGMWCAIRPQLGANGRTTEHVIEMLFHPQVTMDTRIVYEDPNKPAGKTTRQFFVTGVQNPEEANIVIRCLCEEVTP